MHNSEIHKNLDRSDVRDFLAQELEHAQSGSGGADVEWLIAEIKRYEELLINAQHLKATIELLETCGWTDWDISDKVPYNSEIYFPFVGTEEEYADLLAQIAKEREARE